MSVFLPGNTGAPPPSAPEKQCAAPQSVSRHPCDCRSDIADPPSRTAGSNLLAHAGPADADARPGAGTAAYAALLDKCESLLRQVVQRWDALNAKKDAPGWEVRTHDVDGKGGGAKAQGSGPRQDGVDGSDRPPTDNGGNSGASGKDGGRGDIGPGHGALHNNGLDKRYDFQAAGRDSVKVTGNTLAVDFQQGRLTTNSTSPRAELRDTHTLNKGGSYFAEFGLRRDKNTGSTFFQVLDHNGTTPKPRFWLSTTEGGRITLNLRTSADKNGAIQHVDLGKAEVGKTQNIRIDFKRDIGNGSLKIMVDDKVAFSKANISTMYDTHSNEAYMKFGQYRNVGDRRPGTVYFENFRSGGG